MQPCHVLLVEDDRVTAAMTLDRLHGFHDRSGIRFQCAQVMTLRDACQQLAQQAFDAVVSDLGLPDCRGVRTIALLRAEHPDMPIVAHTADGTLSTMLEAIEAGGDGHLVKGEGADATLARVILQAIERRNMLTRLRRSEETRLAEVAKLTDSLRARNEELTTALREAQAATFAKSAFLANMSHEIRTPMTAILGYADMLTEDGDLRRAPQQRIETIRRIRHNGEHLLALINDILDHAKVEAGKLSVEKLETSLVQIVAETVSVIHAKAVEKHLPLRVVWDGLVPAMIQTDPIRLRQILMNLLGNAVKFTERGQVELRIRIEPSPGVERTSPAPFDLRFDVTDTGVGIPPEQIHKIFSPFTQADVTTTRRFGGTGLGLTISRHLARLLGGEIRAESTLGIGSRFTLAIPLDVQEDVKWITPNLSERQPEGPPVPAPQGPDAKPLQGARILFAEDGPDNQRIIAAILKRAGAEVTVVENGRQAIERLTVDGTVAGALRADPPFDVILMDMQMPEMDGHTAAAILRQKNNFVPVIALTAHAMTGDREKCLTVCDDYATKPIDRPKLIGLARDWFQRSQAGRAGSRSLASENTGGCGAVGGGHRDGREISPASPT